MIDGKKVIVYNISHYGYIASVIVHNIVHNKNCKSYLLMDSGWFSKETMEFMSNVKHIPGFSNHVFYDEKYIHKNGDLDIEKNVVSLFDDLFSKMNLNINDIEEVYSGFDRIHAFGIYLAMKNKKHTLFDSNFITTTNLDDLSSNGTEYQTLLSKYRALTWDSPLVEEVIYTLGESIDEIRNTLIQNNHPCKNRKAATGKKLSFFTINQGINTISKSYKDQINDFFKLDLPNKKYTILLLTSFFYREQYENYKSTMTYQETFLRPYRMLLDYIDMDIKNLILKAHPNQPIDGVYLDNVFPNTTYIPGYIPSDVLPMLGLKFENAISPGSNSVSTIDSKRTITLPRSFFQYSSILNKIMAVHILSNYLKMPNIDLSLILPEDLIKSFSSAFTHKFNSQESSATVCIYSNVDAIKNDVSPQNIIVVLDIDSSFLKTKNCQILRIRKEILNQYSLFDLEEEYLGLIINDNDLLEKLSVFSIKKKMLYCGMILEYDVIAPYTYNYIRKIKTEDKERNLKCDNIVAIKNIIRELLSTKNKENAERALGLMYSVAEDGRISDITNRIIDTLLFIESKDSMEKAYDLATSANIKDPNILGRLARMYRDGKGIDKDLDKAIEFMRDADKGNVSWAKLELTDMLLAREGKEDEAEAFVLCNELAEAGNAGGYGRLARMYRDGKGTEKDLDKAVEWMEKAAKKNIWWAKNELFNILLDLDTYESHTSMISIATKFAMEGDGSAMLHLGRMYRDGKGTEKDLDKAVEWMKKAVEKNTGRAKLELTDVLLARGSKEDEAKAFVLCNELAEAGNAGGYGRLARMYRDGKGTEINLKKARELMKIAAESGIGWAKREYEQIDMMIDR